MEDSGEAISNIVDDVRRIFWAINDYSRAAVSSTGLTAPQLWALKILDRSAPLKVSELARHMCLHPATVVGILDRLEYKELLTRVRSREDRRAVELHLTELGRKIVADAPEVAQTMLMKGLAELSAEQIRSVGEGVGLVVRILDAEGVKPQPLQG
jgi:DNA-binding MarR family transcriptional regulator